MIVLDILNPENNSKEEEKKQAKNKHKQEYVKKDHKKVLRVQIININGQIVEVER